MSEEHPKRKRGRPKKNPEPVAALKKVRWTALGENKRSSSEHGRHAEGDEFETIHGDALIDLGYAEAVD